MTSAARAARVAVLAVACIVAGACGTFARSGPRATTTTSPFAPLPQLPELTTPTIATIPPSSVAGPATVPGGAVTTVPRRPAVTPKDVDAAPCAHPVERHAVDRTDAGGLMLRMGVERNCVGPGDPILFVVQVRNPGPGKLYVSSARKTLVDVVAADGTTAWSRCDVKRPPPGAPPDTPAAIEPGDWVTLAEVTYDRSTSRCGLLAPGRYDAFGTVAECTAADAEDGVCNTPRAIVTARIGVEIRP